MKDFARLAWIVFGVGFLLAVIYFFPWKDINWGRMVMSPERMVTVTGYAESKEKNQIASFTAGVNAVKDNKDEAVNEVNNKINAITQAIKTFGVDPTDIQTQSLSIYQNQEQYYDNGVSKMRPGQWNVNSSITVTLRDVERASDLANLLTGGGATNVYGPNFQLDTSRKAEDGLMADAIADAKVKAEAMAAASGTSLGTIISVSEGSGGGVSYPTMYGMKEMGGGGGAALQPGSTNISKTVTVIWSLK